MWAWTPTSSTPGMQLERGHRLGGRARGHGEAELGVLLAGADELVGVRLDARGDPHEHRGPRRRRRRVSSRPPEPGDLVEGVDDDAARPRLERGGQLVVGLVVAVQDQALGGHAGRQRDVQLAAGRDVEAHALLVGQAGHGPAQERLGGVGRRRRPRPPPPPGSACAGGPRRRRRAACRTPAASSSRSMPPTRRWPSSSTAAVRGRSCRSNGAVATSWSVGMGVQDTAGSVREPGTADHGQDDYDRPLLLHPRPRSSADRAPASGAGGAGSSPAGGAPYFRQFT